jgi:hypothetical protein
MTSAQLDTILAQASTALQNNAAFLTPDMLSKIQNLWPQVRTFIPLAVAAQVLTNAQVAQIQTAGDQLVAGETTLITSNETTTIVAAIAELRARTAIMWVIAELLSGDTKARIEDAP